MENPVGWEVTLVLLGPLSLCRNTAGKWVRASGAGSSRANPPRRAGGSRRAGRAVGHRKDLGVWLR